MGVRWQSVYVRCKSSPQNRFLCRRQTVCFYQNEKKNEVLKRLTALRIIATEGDNKNAEDFSYMIDNIAEITGIIGGEKALFESNMYVSKRNFQKRVEIDLKNQ